MGDIVKEIEKLMQASPKLPPSPEQVNQLISALESARAEIERLRKGISVAYEYCAISYCKEHQDWRISGYIFGCGDKH